MCKRLLSLLLLAGSANAQQLDLELVVSGLGQPTSMAAPPADPAQLLISERVGLVRVVRAGNLLPVPFLDVSAQTDIFGEGGLLSLALHPLYGENGRFFVSYTTADYHLHVEEYAVSGDPDVALPAPVQTIYAVAPTGGGSHWAGDIAFGTDGKLYVSVGDHGTSTAAQDYLDPRGSILRLDVDLPPPFIPADNPFVNDPNALDELWLKGLRNPWRLSFDASTGDLWIGDVGLGSREELDVFPAGSIAGANYGWPCLEGTHCTGNPACDCADIALVAPIFEYNHNHSSDYRCVIGGHVYRGTSVPDLAGRYVHGDWASCKVWSFRYEGGAAVDWTDHTLELDPTGELLDHLVSFGLDHAGELCVLDYKSQAGVYEGELYRVVSACRTESYCLANPNSSGQTARIRLEGSTRLSQGDVTLVAEGAVPDQFGLFYYGDRAVEIPFGDGYRCVAAGSAGLFRFGPAQLADAQGTASLAVDLSAPPAGSGPGQWTAGSTWYLQYWYRDPMGVASGFNLSDGLSALFCL